MFMSKLIALSDGHGINTAGKRTPTLPNGQKSEIGRPYMNENLFNRAVVKYLDKLLRDNGFKTLLVAPTDEDTPLSIRTNLANSKKADLYISVHANANTGQWGDWGGIETYTWKSGDSLKLGKLIHAELLKGSPLKDRGVKDGSHLWEIRKPSMPSVLIEAGFMDSHHDYKYLLSDAYRRETAIEIATGICKFYGVPFKNTLNSSSNSSSSKSDTKTDTKTTTYTVKKGDTLWSISREFDITVTELKSLNGLTSNVIKVGQKLKVSGNTKSKPQSETKPKTPASKVETQPTDVYGTLTVMVENLNVREKPDFNSKIVKVIHKGEKYKVYGQKNGLYNLGGNQWTTANSKYVSFVKNTGYKADTKKVQVLASSLWVYNKADWNAKYKTVKKGEVFTIKSELIVNGSKMYQLKSGLYITANSKYVKLV
jgi:N-acetylmuramoyl-L-alanine amidase/LysM repeat protein